MINFLAAIFLFGLLIFFHELGHFIFAKLVGVKVLKFSFGFGPRLIGKKIGETDYIISALPFGGYVKPLGEDPDEEIPEEDRSKAYNSKPTWKRALIVFAGPMFNFLLAYIIFTVFLSMDIPVKVLDLDALTDTTIENIAEGSPAITAGLKEGDILVSINGEVIDSWVEMEKIFFESPGKELDLRVKRGDELIDTAIVLDTEKIKNRAGEEIEAGRSGISKFTHVIGQVVKNSPAMDAGLQRGDLIKFIDGKPVRDWNEMTEIISKNPGKTLALRVKRGNDLIETKVVPEAKKEKDSEGREVIKGRIGVGWSGPYYIIQSDNILEAPVKGLIAVYDWSVLTIKTIGKLLAGSLSVKNLAGPITIVDIASKAATRGMTDYFDFVAIISINLAILNLLPIPVLDGGHLMFLSVEALRRKPLSDKLMRMATTMGFSLLLILIAVVFYNDIVRVIIPLIQRLIST